MGTLINITDAVQNSFLYSWDRETWEAFVQEPWFRKNLSDAE